MLSKFNWLNFLFLIYFSRKFKKERRSQKDELSNLWIISKNQIAKIAISKYNLTFFDWM